MGSRGSVRIDDVLPPVVRDPIGGTLDVGQKVEPPEVMGAGIALPPVAGVHDLSFPVEKGKVLPGVIPASDLALVAPVVIAEAVGGEVDVAHLGPARMRLVVTRKSFPEVGLASQVAEEGFDHGLRPVAHVLQHFPDAALKAEAHDDKPTLGMRSIGQCRRVAPEGSRSGHGGLPKARVWEGEQPDLVDLPAVDPVDDVKVCQDAVIVRAIRFVESAATAEAMDVLVTVVDEAVGVDRKPVYFESFDYLEVGVAVARVAQVLDVTCGQEIGIVPAGHFDEPAIAVSFDPGIIDDQ